MLSLALKYSKNARKLGVGRVQFDAGINGLINLVKGCWAANNGWSTDNVRSELSIDWTNPWIARHVVRSFTDSFREILIFNYLIIMWDIHNIRVSE